MKKTIKLLEGIKILDSKGCIDQLVASVIFDSRKVKKDSLFVAVKGTTTDGHQYIAKAIEKGANTIVCETIPERTKADVTYFKVEDSAEALAIIAANFYDKPSAKLKLTGVTGTNGKTTTVTLLYRLFTALGYKTGLISTIENRIVEVVLPATHTTPNPVELNGLLAEMAEKGCEYAFMEVSSHAIHQKRIAGLTFAGGIFTNLTHEHLDYHKTFGEYIKAKKKFFDVLGKNSFALTNIDDKNGRVMIQNTVANVRTYGLKKPADFKAKIIENSLAGLHLELNGVSFFSRLIGEFNAYNLTAVFAAARLLGIETMTILTTLSGLTPPAGRFEYVFDEKRHITGIVDFAHTPDALEKVLVTIDDLKQENSKVITVVGAGGDRDKTKRPAMAKIAVTYSDKVILTSDNPRSEDPAVIVEDMKKGIEEALMPKVLAIVDRGVAIKTATMIASKGDIILLAGKGHENYQIINGEKTHFDDKEELRKYF